jgi:hypothetical protein
VFQVDIWQERRVFGSRAGGIKDVMLGTAPLPVLDMTKKRSHSSTIKIVKRDSRSVKLVSFTTPSTQMSNMFSLLNFAMKFSQIILLSLFRD